LTKQLLTPTKINNHQPHTTNFFDALSSDLDTDIVDATMHTMEIDSTNSQETPKSSNQTVVASWTMDAGVSELSDDFFLATIKKTTRRGCG